MSETQKQALIRFGRVMLSALIAAGATAAPELLDAFVLDPTLRAAAIIILTGLIEAVLKLIGGATETLKLARGRSAADERPSWLSV